MGTQTKEGERLAGLVLALLGAITYGATSPFGLVLCGEWLCDPNRARGLRRWDWVGLVLAIPGTAFFIWLSVGLFDNAPLAWMIAGYWGSFALWLRGRSRTRWRELRPTQAGESNVATDGAAR